jgi:hypothetical protein
LLGVGPGFRGDLCEPRLLLRREMYFHAIGDTAKAKLGQRDAIPSSLRSDDSAGTMPPRQGNPPVVFLYFLPAVVRWRGEG